jgi:hypothetical protein
MSNIQKTNKFLKETYFMEYIYEQFNCFTNTEVYKSWKIIKKSEIMSEENINMLNIANNRLKTEKINNNITVQELYDMLISNYQMSKNINEIGIEDGVSSLLNGISKQNNLVDKLNFVMEYYNDFFRAIFEENREEITVFLENLILEKLKTKKHLIFKVFKSKEKFQRLNYMVFVQQDLFEVYDEMMGLFLDYNISPLGERMRTEVSYMPIDEYNELSDIYQQDYNEIEI